LEHYRPFCFIRHFCSARRPSLFSKRQRRTTTIFVIAILTGAWSVNATLAQNPKPANQNEAAPRQVEAMLNVEGVYFTKSFILTAPCDGSDIVYRNAVNDGTPSDGKPKSDGWKIRPWDSGPIKVKSVGLVYMAGAHQNWLMVGSNIVGDSVVFLSEGENQRREVFPAGTFKWMPARDKAGPLDYFDLHGTCTTSLWRRWTPWIETMTVFVDIGYTRDDRP
jgi:hypothetical protein